MKIPSTEKIDVSTINCWGTGNELFCFYLPKSSSPDHLKDFVQSLDGFLPGFVLSKRCIENHESQRRRGLTRKTLLEISKECLKRTSEVKKSDISGEFGEFLLYLFAKEVKRIRKVVSKIQDKGARDSAALGRDGVFIDTSGTEIYVLMGEAKMRPYSNDGLKEAKEDANKFWESDALVHEIGLASRCLKDELDENDVRAYESYFISDNPSHATLKYKNIIFIGYSSEDVSALMTGCMELEAFKENVKAVLTRNFETHRELVLKTGVQTVYCFVPFKCVDLARKAFADHHGLTL